MKLETIAIHVGYDGDPTTKAVAVPIYQTIAFEFDTRRMVRLYSTSKSRETSTLASEIPPTRFWKNALRR